jgi:hypothetical protein
MGEFLPDSATAGTLVMPPWEFHFTFWVAHRTTSGLPMGVLERLDQDTFPNLLGLENTFRPQNFRYGRSRQGMQKPLLARVHQAADTWEANSLHFLDLRVLWLETQSSSELFAGLFWGY